MPRGFYALIAAQFTSPLADNALLIVAIALLQERSLPGWWAPLLKVGFTLSYVVLAPLVGPLADAFPKARLMAWMNAVKVTGVTALLVGVHPVAAFVVVGFGAAAYAPAKYGLTTELVGPCHLVAANGWLEVPVVCAALLGTTLGGLLVSPWWLGSVITVAGQGAWLALNESAGLQASAYAVSMMALVAVYVVAGLLNIGVPDSGARYAAGSIHPIALTREFMQASRLFWRDRDGGLSLAVTTIFWGVGAALQFVILRWAAAELQLPLERAAYLQGAVAVGVILGASAAGRWVPLCRAKRMLVNGVLLGLLMPVVASSGSWVMAVPLLALVGAVGGLLVVPLNALLQHRGCALLSAGRSVAVQGYNENASVLVMLGICSGLIALDVPIAGLMWGLGIAIAAAMGLLMLRERRRVRGETRPSETA